MIFLTFLVIIITLSAILLAHKQEEEKRLLESRIKLEKAIEKINGGNYYE